MIRHIFENIWKYGSVRNALQDLRKDALFWRTVAVLSRSKLNQKCQGTLTILSKCPSQKTHRTHARTKLTFAVSQRGYGTDCPTWSCPKATNFDDTNFPPEACAPMKLVLLVLFTPSSSWRDPKLKCMTLSPIVFRLTELTEDWGSQCCVLPILRDTKQTLLLHLITTYF